MGRFAAVLALALAALVLPLGSAFAPRRVSSLSGAAGLRVRRAATAPPLSMAIFGPERYGTTDWIACIASLPTSRILARTRWHICFFTLWSALVTWLFKATRFQSQVPQSLLTVFGPALSLLLVFRTNSSYDRFWEARKAQSQIIYASRFIATHAWVHIPSSHHRQVAALLAAYALVQKQHLQGVVIDSELAPLLPPAQVASIQSRRNRPLFLLRDLEALIHAALVEKYKAGGEDCLPSTPKYIEKHFMEGMHQLGAALAACERILKQPVPLSYSRHTSRFLSLYLFLLPFALVTQLGWATVPAVAAICWSLVSILEISHFIEEPFDRRTQVIPLNQIASVIRADVSGKRSHCAVLCCAVLCPPLLSLSLTHSLALSLSLSQLYSRAEVLGGVLDGAAWEQVDARLRQETKDNSREEVYQGWGLNIRVGAAEAGGQNEAGQMADVVDHYDQYYSTPKPAAAET